MKLYHIVAMARNRVIGRDNKLPWHFSSDLKHFKKITMGSSVIMGRKTFESIGKPLPNRQNLVLSRSIDKDSSEIKYCKCLEDALKHVSADRAFIIGGADLYNQTMDQIDGIYASFINEDYNGDVRYPEIPGLFIEKTRTCLQKDPVIEAVYLERQKKQ